MALPALSIDVRYPFQITRFCSMLEDRFERDHVFTGGIHTFWEFFLVLEGELEIVKDDNVYYLSQNDMLCIAPMEFHRNRSCGQTSPHLLSFSFVHEGTLPETLKNGVFELSTEKCAELCAIVYRFLQSGNRSEPSPMLVAETAYAMSSFLLHLSQNNSPQARVLHSDSVKMYRKLVRTMQSAIYDNLSIPEIAEANSISVSTMKNLFHSYAGMPPKRYYSNLRGMEALRLLEAGVPIVEISEKLRYSSYNYFSLCFKKQFGVSPTEKRRLSR